SLDATTLTLRDQWVQLPGLVAAVNEAAQTAVLAAVRARDDLPSPPELDALLAPLVGSAR
ncbi:MAG: hypothetical protein ACTHU0_22440, partial [Kofleriaceae bacterium]